MKLSPCLLLLVSTACAQNSWKFAVSGDSRNCGNIVMPAIAQEVRESGAEFYWHLGDFRAISTVDEDLAPPPQLGLPPKSLSISDYESVAWPAFIAHQLDPFGNLAIFLTPGNHETIPPATRDLYLEQFADWLEQPVLRAQRLKDNPQDHRLRSYYHWIRANVDFVALDNASADQFDYAQLRWIHSVIDRDEKSPQIRTIVVGMHQALPGSWGESHSMSQSAQGDKSGREVYSALLHAQNAANKHIYIFASHSHFYMEDVYHTDTWKGRELPGWIVGTAGAVRYRLPQGVTPGPKAMTDVYGFLIASVSSDGTVATSFHKLNQAQLQRASPAVPKALVQWCYDHNSQ
jgi:hypothetical protein